MKNTKLLQFNDADLFQAADIIRSGGLVAFPTETVFGLGANALDAKAVEGIFTAKGRPSDNPLIVHIWNKNQICEIASEVSPRAQKIIDNLMPASITIVLKKKPTIPNIVTANLDTVAIRMPLSVQARKFLQYVNLPIAAPSANTSSRPSPTTWQAVQADLKGKIDAILCGDNCDVGIESTVLDLTQDIPIILRPGIVTPSQISAILGVETKVLNDIRSKVNSPGVHYKHYAPKCPMVLNVDGNIDVVCNFYDKQVQNGKKPVILTTNTTLWHNRNTYDLGKTDIDVARNLYAALRQCEQSHDFIVAVFSGCGEIADSILNRLQKAANGSTVGAFCKFQKGKDI